MSSPEDPVFETLNDPLRPKLLLSAKEYVVGLEATYTDRDDGWETALGRFPVTRVDVRKQDSLGEHEYAVAHVDVGGVVSYVMFSRSGDRQPQDPPSLPTLGNNFAEAAGPSPSSLDNGHVPQSQDPPNLCQPPALSTPTPTPSREAGPTTASLSLARPESSTSTHFQSLSRRFFKTSPSLASLDSLAKTLPALDTVTLLPDPYEFHTDRVILTLNLAQHSQPLYLHEVALAASYLHHDNSTYKLFSSNCFWFTASLMHILEVYTSKSAEVIGKKNALGHWTQAKIPVYQRPKDPEGLNEGVQRYRQDITAFLKRVCERRRKANDIVNPKAIKIANEIVTEKAIELADEIKNEIVNEMDNREEELERQRKELERQRKELDRQRDELVVE